MTPNQDLVYVFTKWSEPDVYIGAAAPLWVGILIVLGGAAIVAVGIFSYKNYVKNKYQKQGTQGINVTKDKKAVGDETGAEDLGDRLFVK